MNYRQPQYESVKQTAKIKETYNSKNCGNCGNSFQAWAIWKWHWAIQRILDNITQLFHTKRHKENNKENLFMSQWKVWNHFMQRRQFIKQKVTKQV